LRNTILLTIDTLRKDALGCYSQNELTPFIDSILKKSIRFDNAYSGGPYTQAGFPGILSSTYYLDFGRQKGKCPPERILISQVLGKAGIKTAAIHSNAYLCEFFGWNKGWDYFYDSMDMDVTDKVPYIKAEEINTKAYDWLKKNKEENNEKPFFLWLHYMDVHEPYIPEKQYLKIAAPEISLTEEEMMDLFKNVLLKRDVSKLESVELLYKLYKAHIVEVDQAVKKFFMILEELGFDDSVVIITSDHGDEFNEHGGLSHDGKMYEELVHVPLIIYDPSLDDALVSNTIVSTLDIPPTIAYMFNQNPDPGWQGESLLPINNRRTVGVFGEAIDKYGNNEKGDEAEVHFYREKEYKIIYCETDNSWELYNLNEDPKEQNNIISLTTIEEYFMKKVIPRVRRFEKK